MTGTNDHYQPGILPSNNTISTTHPVSPSLIKTWCSSFVIAVVILASVFGSMIWFTSTMG